MSNGYFRIGCTPNGTILKLVAPTDGGEMVSAKEITEYLSNKGILYTTSTVGQGIDALAASGKPDHLVLLNKDMIGEIKESYLLKATPDKMTLTMRLYPPSMKGVRLSAEEFIQELGMKGVKFGIDEARIRAFFSAPQYCTDFVVAQGEEVQQGQSAKIEYYFDTELSMKPAHNEDGTVDFFNLKTFSSVKAGDILARLIPEVRGVNGTTVFGEVIKAAEVKRRILKCGRNITISEDGMVMTADINGHVSLADDKVFLSDVMELDNVGPATGNIDYDGNITILGNVQENFKVKAGGSVTVKGVVEGAEIEAGVDIIIARGMKGMGKGTLKAGNNILSKFIENSTATAAGFIETDLILHSNVSAGTDIVVNGRKGFITGGRVSAKNKIQVRNLGSEMGADTVIEVGADPGVKVRIQQLQKGIQDMQKAIEQSKPTIAGFMAKMQSGASLSMDQKLYMKSILEEDKAHKIQLEEMQTEYDSLEDVLDTTTDSVVEVSGEVYAGTKICISDVSMIVKSTMKYCRFKKIDGDVKMQAL